MPKVRTAVVELEKLVPGGQAIGQLDSGKKIFVWGGLPGEKVEVMITRVKTSHAEGIVSSVISASKERIEPKDPESYMSTSPWQIVSYDLENSSKKDLVAEIARQHKVDLPEFKIENKINDSSAFYYRNKMEYSFYGDDDGLHLALFRRGTHGKIMVNGSSLADPIIDKTANNVLELLSNLEIRAGDLKSLIIRSFSSGQVSASLFVKTKKFPKLSPENLHGFSVYYSDPRSPASVITEEIYHEGSQDIKDLINGREVNYGVNGFFQVNIPVFEMAVKTIEKYVDNQPIIDMYGGVGTISASIGSKDSVVVESDEINIEYARKNLDQNSKAIHAKSELALDYIVKKRVLIVDPPRAGLHTKLIDKIKEVQPEQIIYLSCNPVTMMRDLKELSIYELEHFGVYNFFPRTPHIETLAVLKLT